MSTSPVRGLLRAPHDTIPSGFVAERWLLGADTTRRRLRQLHNAGLKISTKRDHEYVRLSAEPGADRTRVDYVEYTYSDPQRKAPPVERAMVAGRRVHLPAADEEHDVCPVAFAGGAA